MGQSVGWGGRVQASPDRSGNPILLELTLVPIPLTLQKVMEAMGILAIVVNCYLIGQCGQLQRLFPWLSPEAAIISVVVLEVQTG